MGCREEPCAPLEVGIHLGDVGDVVFVGGKDADDAGWDGRVFGFGDDGGVGFANRLDVGEEFVEGDAMFLGEVGMDAVGGLFDGVPGAFCNGGVGGGASFAGGEGGEGASEGRGPLFRGFVIGCDDEEVGRVGGGA